MIHRQKNLKTVRNGNRNRSALKRSLKIIDTTACTDQPVRVNLLLNYQ